MSDQLDLFSLSKPEPGKIRFELFLALLPDENGGDDISRLATRMSWKHDLSGKLIKPEHLHVSLHSFGGYAEIPRELISEIDQVFKNSTEIFSPFEVTFDRVVTFANSRWKKPFVLRSGPDGNILLSKFHRDLMVFLFKNGMNQGHRKSFTPHVTLAWDPREIKNEFVEPVSWKVRELVLVLSHIGETKHEWPMRWKFQGEKVCANQV